MLDKIRFCDRKMLYQYFVEYGIVVLLTVLLMMILLNWTLQDYKETLISDAETEVQTCMSEFDELLKMQEALAKEIYLNNLTNPRYMMKGTLNVQKGTQQLSLYQKTMRINDYILLRYQEDIYYNQEGELSRDTMLGDVLDLDGDSRKLFLKMISNHKEEAKVVLTKKNGKKILACFYPMLNALSESEDMIVLLSLGNI